MYFNVLAFLGEKIPPQLKDINPVKYILRPLDIYRETCLLVHSKVKNNISWVKCYHSIIGLSAFFFFSNNIVLQATKQYIY